MSIIYLVIAQAVVSPAVSEVPFCAVFTRQAADASAPVVHANCRGTGFVLGPADEFRSIENRELGATIVDMTLGSERKILLLRSVDGKPMLENLTGSLAKSAGRGPMSDIHGLEIDLGSFAADTVIAVRAPADEKGASGKSGRVHVGGLVAADRARRRAGQVSN